MAEQGQRVLLLAGRSWFLRHIDWRRRVVHVEPSDQLGVANWFGDAQGGLRGVGAGEGRAQRAKEISGHEATTAIRAIDLKATTIRPLLSKEALRGLKFSDCLPEHLALGVLERRLDARTDATDTLAEPRVTVPSG